MSNNKLFFLDQHTMNSNLKNLMLSELSGAYAYFDRILHALVDISGYSQEQNIKTTLASLQFEINEIMETSLFKECFTSTHQADQVTTKSSRAYVTDTKDLLTSFIKIGLNQNKTLDIVIEVINTIYTHCYGLHKLADEITDLSIQLPRVNLVEVQDGDEIDKLANEVEKLKVPKAPYQVGPFTVIEGGRIHEVTEEEEEDEDYAGPIPLFQLKKESFLRFGEPGLGGVESINWQRDKKYNECIQAGHEAVFEKEYGVALEKFLRAINYNETAEALTLTGWAYSLLNQMEKAKSYCLKAIHTDADYGPPYNDLGTYLLNEGHYDESIKWFNLAKKATNYQNREYPYINAGRAYMNKKDMTKALEEFSQALSLAPFNEELHKTVERLKKSLMRSRQYADSEENNEYTES